MDPYLQKIISISTVGLGSLVVLFGSAILQFTDDSSFVVVGVIAIIVGSTMMQRMLLINPFFSLIFWGVFAFSFDAWWPLLGLIAVVFHLLRVLVLAGTYKQTLSFTNRKIVSEYVGPIYFTYAPVGTASFLMLICAQYYYSEAGFDDLSAMSWMAVGLFVVGLIKAGTLGGEGDTRVGNSNNQTFCDKPFDYDFRNTLRSK